MSKQKTLESLTYAACQTRIIVNMEFKRRPEREAAHRALGIHYRHMASGLRLNDEDRAAFLRDCGTSI